MNEQFDPITGQPITDNSGQMTVGFDPMTGELIGAVDSPSQSGGSFDPMTGMPLGGTQGGGFDPMTGQPIGGAQGQPGGFDPMTGMPLGGAQGSGFDPMTGKPLTGKQKAPKMKGAGGKNNLLIPGIIGAVAVVAIAVIMLVTSGAFLSKQNKILLATANTFKDSSKLTKVFEGLGLLASDSFTITANVEADGDSVNSSFAYKGGEMQLSASVDVSGIPELRGAVIVDSKQVRAKVDGVDYALVYSYTEKNDGYLVEEIGEENIEIVNEVLSSLTSKKQKNDIGKDIAKAALAEFNDWKFEKVSKKQFKIDGKERKCVGYTTTVAEDDVLALMEAVYKVVEENMDIEELEDAYSDLEEEFEDMPDMDVTVYVYDKMLAAILLEVDGEEMEILFKGGDTRWQNLKVEIEGEEILTLKGKTADSVEKYALEVGGAEVLNVEYNPKTSEFEMEAGRYMFGTAVALKANVQGNANKLTIDLKRLEVGGDSGDVDLQIELKSGAKIGNISGKEFDLGNADEDDFEDLAEEFEDMFF